MVELGRLLAELGASVLGALPCGPGTTSTVDKHVLYAFKICENARMRECRDTCMPEGVKCDEGCRRPLGVRIVVLSRPIRC